MPVPLTVTVVDVVVGPGVEIVAIDGASGVDVTVKLELAALQKPDTGSWNFAMSVWVPSESSESVAVQLPLAFAVAVPIERRALVDLDEPGCGRMAGDGCAGRDRSCGRRDRRRSRRQRVDRDRCRGVGARRRVGLTSSASR